MLERDVFRIRVASEETNSAALTASNGRVTSADSSASQSIEKPPPTCTADVHDTHPQTNDPLRTPEKMAPPHAEIVDSGARAVARQRQTSPRTPGAEASSQHQILADRAAASFRQDRRLQRGQIHTKVEQRSSQRAMNSAPAISSSAAAPLPPVSPTWSGLPTSVLHGSKSPVCLPLPASDNGISDTEHAATATEQLPLPPPPPPPLPTSSSSADDRLAFPAYASLTAEDDEGDVEYKWRLTGISATRFQHLVTQMQFRVSEGRGQCLYELGVSDDGTPRGLTRRDFDESVQTIQRMAAQLQLDATLLQCCAVPPSSSSNVSAMREPRRDAAGFVKASTAAAAAATSAEEELYCGEIMVSRRQSSSAHDLSVAFCGAVGCGKSTLMAVLLTARLDDGRGGTRQSLFNHKHELDSGRTSSLASRVWTVPPDGAVAEVAYAVKTVESPPLAPLPSTRFMPTWSPASSPVVSAAPPTPPFTSASPRSITLLDAGGDVTKTMLFGLMSRKPDYVCVCVAADTSDVADVSLYAEVCCAMNTPYLVVVTKCDCVEEFELDGLVMELTVALEKVGCAAEPVDSLLTAAAYCREWLPRHRDAAVYGGGGGGGGGAAEASPTASPTSALPDAAAARLHVPMFCVSSVEGGSGLDLLRSCLSHLQNPPPSPPQSPPSCLSKPPFEVLLDCAFVVDDVGPVVHGRVAHGPVEVGCSCYIGPGSDGRFYSVLVRGIHVDGEHVNVAQVGDEATFALDRLPEAVTVAHKGKVLVRQPERVAMTFEATVQVVSQSISAHMEPIMYTRNARQAVNVEAVTGVSGGAAEAAGQRSQDGHRECRVRCRFLFRPEVVGPGDAVVLHWAPRGIAVGRITAVGTPGK